MSTTVNTNEPGRVASINGARPSGAPVRLSSVLKQFGGFTAVDRVSIDIEAGEFLTLLGPSGSGKTTILSMVAGFETPTAGTITIGARRVDTLSPDKRDVGMVFQNYALFPHMTVAQNVAFPLRMRGLARREIEPKVMAALELVRLAEQAPKLPTQLSGGQQQRVALARALVYEPTVLLMDEPLGALDRRLREHVQLELIELHRTIATTIIYVTHDQDEALTMSDRIAVMRDGQIIQVGTPKQIYDQPSDAFVAEFVGESTLLSGTVRGGTAPTYTIDLEGGALVEGQSTRPVEAGCEVRLLIRPEKVTIRSIDQDRGRDGTVVDALYLGDSTRYRIEFANHCSLLARSHNRADQMTHRVGDRVKVDWQPVDAFILR